MPHVVIAEGPEPTAVYESFEPGSAIREGTTVLELGWAYLRRDGETVLIQATAVELGPPVHFFVAVERKRQRITVRCFPHPHVERTDGVKKLVAEVARRVLADGGRVTKTNLDWEEHGA